MRFKIGLLLSMGLIPMFLAGCQGTGFGSDDDDATEAGDDDTQPGDDDSSQSTSDSVTVELTQGAAFQTLKDGAFVTISDPASSSGWDLKVDGASFNLNGGESGPGAAWSFGPVGTGEAEYDAFTNHNDVTIPLHFEDEFDSALADWYYYAGPPNHTIYSKYHVYALKVDSSHTWKVQMLSYYGEKNYTPISGVISFRYADIGSSTPITAQVDASDKNSYRYFSFATGAQVNLTDEQAASSKDWDFGFKRYYVKVNGGVSGTKGVVGFDFQGSKVETDDEIIKYTAESQLPDFTSASSAGLSGTWVADKIGCGLNDSYSSDGSGKPAPNGNVYVILGADGVSYYKFLVTDLQLDGSGNPASVTYRVAAIQ